MERLCIMVHWDTRIHTVVEMLSKVRADYIGLLVLILPDGYAMLMRPNKAETAVPGCHCPGDMAVRMRKVLARPWVAFIVVTKYKGRIRWLRKQC